VSPPRLAGAILAGGGSRRLGRDKAAEHIGEDRLIDRAAFALRPHCGEVFVVSSRPDTPTGPWSVIHDVRPPCGPLGGIEAALLHAGKSGYDAVAVLAVDLPLVDATSIGALAAASAESEGGVVAAARTGDPDFEPLCAVYPVSCLATVVELLEGGERAAQALFQTVGGVRVQGASGASVNVNSAADLAQVAALLQRDVDEPSQ